MTGTIKKGVLKINADETFGGSHVFYISAQISELLKKSFTHMVLDLSENHAPDAGTLTLIHALANESMSRGMRLQIQAASLECAYLLNVMRMSRQVDLTFTQGES
jgi:hypothetical protein